MLARPRRTRVRSGADGALCGARAPDGCDPCGTPRALPGRDPPGNDVRTAWEPGESAYPLHERTGVRGKGLTLLLLISPDGVDEALDCAKAAEHLDIVDVKKPDEGSLGANYPWVIREIRAAVPADKPVSATVGDVPYKPGTVAQAALGAAVSGATYIKVGLYGCGTPEQAVEVMRGVVRAVKDHRPDAFVVASGYADAHRIGCVNPLALPDIARRSGSDAAMLDTAIKDGPRRQTRPDPGRPTALNPPRTAAHPGRRLRRTPGPHDPTREKAWPTRHRSAPLRAAWRGEWG